MPISLDLNLLPVARAAGRDYPELLGLYAAAPPRRTARGRGQDRLVLYLAVEGNAPLPPGQQADLLASLARLYYDTPGSATAAMRKVADELNTTLLERNNELARSSRQGLGLLAQLVVREGQFTLAFSGPLQAYLISATETRQFYNPDLEGRGLGQGRSTPLTYFQAALQPNDTLLLAAQPAPGWNVESLAGLHGQGPETLRRKLFSPAELSLNALLVQARPGKGNLYLPKPGVPAAAEAPAAAPASAAVSTAAAVAATIAAPAVAAAPAIPVDPSLPPAAPEIQEGPPAPDEPLPDEAAGTFPPGEAVEAQLSPPAGEVSAAPAVSTPAPSTDRQRRSAFAALKSAVAGGLLAVAGGIQRSGQAVRATMVRVLPDETFMAIPTALLVLIALAVPVMIVAIASTAYLRLGRQAQYQALYSQAREVAVQAAEESDVTTRRLGLEAALRILDEAQRFGPTEDVKTLRSQVISTLDEIDRVIRLDFQPAIINGLPVGINVVQMVTQGGNLYMLDGNRGTVLRAQRTDQGYALDETFQCGADTVGPLAMGPAVGIAAWPASYKPAAEILAIDSKGNLLFCTPDRPPLAASLTPGGEGPWGDIRSFALDVAQLYVLDLASQQAWIYWLSNLVLDETEAGTVPEPPVPFFSEDPPSLSTVVDTGVNRDDYYLLNNDGVMVICTPNTVGAGPTRCVAQPYVDFRPGRENTQLNPPGPFSQMQITDPPEPSLFMLEPLTHGVYHFSLRSLAFQKIFLPDETLLPRPATAFSVDTTGRMMYLALGGSVYYAAMP